MTNILSIDTKGWPGLAALFSHLRQRSWLSNLVTVSYWVSFGGEHCDVWKFYAHITQDANQLQYYNSPPGWIIFTLEAHRGSKPTNLIDSWEAALHISGMVWISEDNYLPSPIGEEFGRAVYHAVWLKHNQVLP